MTRCHDSRRQNTRQFRTGYVYYPDMYNLEMIYIVVQCLLLDTTTLKSKLLNTHMKYLKNLSLCYPVPRYCLVPSCISKYIDHLDSN